MFEVTLQLLRVGAPLQTTPKGPQAHHHGEARVWHRRGPQGGRAAFRGR